MGLATMQDYQSTVGQFVEKDVRGTHEYSLNTDEMTGAWEFPHILHTLDGYRYARVLKTVAYIAVDEDEYGLPVVEKWDITSHKVWDKS
jgi:hypothetical protein